MKCPACYGSGIEMGNRPEDDCTKCGGSGEAPRVEGVAIADSRPIGNDMHEVAIQLDPRYAVPAMMAVREDSHRDAVAIVRTLAAFDYGDVVETGWPALADAYRAAVEWVRTNDKGGT